MDDLDDVLNDLLSDDPAPKKKQPQAKRATGRGGKSGLTVHDDDFYKSLAADAESMSDVSDADPATMLKGMDDLDDMDAALFGGKQKPKTPPAVTKPAAPPSPTKTTASPSRTAPVKKAAAIDFDDYDDPLADILNDEPKTSKPKRSEVQAKLKEDPLDKIGYSPTPAAPAKEPEDSSSSESRRLEINRPPTRSGNTKPARREEHLFSDDEDALGGLGFDDSPRTKPIHKKMEEEAPKGRSIMDDLLGTGSVTKHLEKPGSSGGGGGGREFVLDKKYQKKESKQKEFGEDDFNFGGYMPSAVTTPGSRPSSKRSVRFEDDDGLPSRGASGGGLRSSGTAGILEDMITKDDRDWLDIASNETPSTSGDRPRSEGNNRSKDPEKPGTAQSAASEPVDWLGLSRLGSPKLMSKENIDEEIAPKPEVSLPRSGGRVGIPREVPEESDDWLGTNSASIKSKPEKKPATMDKDADWLGTSSASAKDNDWLGTSTSSGKGMDWLGVRDSPRSKDSDPDSWLGFSKAKDEGKSEDWLGVSNKKTTMKDSPASGDFLELTSGIDDPFKSTSKSRADERGLDLFSPPPSKDNASFPWDSETSGSRHGGRSRTPQRGGRGASPGRTSPKRPASPRGPSPADSPRDLMATLDALKKMDQPKKQGPVKATLMSTPPVATPTTKVEVTTAIASPVYVPTTSMPTTPVLSVEMPGMNAQMESLRQQEEMYRKQQQLMMEQQQKQQMEQQRIMAEQQDQRRQQMQQMAEAQQRMMEQQISQMSQIQIPSIPMSMPMGFGSSMVGDELMQQVKRLEMEKMHLMTMLDTTKQQHTEEIRLMEDAHKKRIEFIDESANRREQRLREENEFLMAQSQKKMEMVEQEKADLVESNLRKQDLWDRENRAEIERLREQHRQDMEGVRREHEQGLERLRRAKDMEVEAVANQHSTTENLRSVMSQISENTRGLNELQTQVHVKHNLSLDERETAVRYQDEQLRALQERLEKQNRDTELERARLQGVVSKMEVQLTEQQRSMEEDKWRVRQEEARLQAAQDALEKEKSVVMQQLKRDRESIQKAKDQLLEEQKTVLAQLYEERRQLAQERAAFDMEIKLNTDKVQRENLKNVKTGAELEGSVRIINDEKGRLAEQLDDLRAEREQLSKDRAELQQKEKSLDVEKEKLETIALQVRQRSKDIEEMCLAAADSRETGEKAHMEARRIEAEHTQRIANIQAQIQTLHTKEKQIAQERLSLAKEKANIEANAKSLLCVSCRTPVKDGAMLSAGNVSIQETAALNRKMTPAATSLLSALDPDLRAKVTALDSVSAEIEMDRSIRMWRIAAKKDEDFLTEESMFLHAIRHTPYSDTASL